jgi:hypothetical protein
VAPHGKCTGQRCSPLNVVIKLCPALLLPSLQLLSYHVVPAGAVRAAELTDGQRLTTLLEGAPALRVDIDEDDGQRQVEIEVGSVNYGRCLLSSTSDVLLVCSLSVVSVMTYVGICLRDVCLAP